MQSSIRVLFGLLVTLTAACATSPSERNTPEGMLQSAADVVTELRREQPGIEYFLERAEGVLIFPRVSRGAAVVGIAGGDSVLVERNGKAWGNPRFMTASGISFGAQAGVETAKVVVVVMNKRLLGSLAKGSIDFGAGVTLALGPADVKAASSLQTFQDAYVFRDAGGAFLGVALDGVMAYDDRARNATYRNGPPSATQESNLYKALDVSK